MLGRVSLYNVVKFNLYLNTLCPWMTFDTLQIARSCNHVIIFGCPYIVMIVCISHVLANIVVMLSSDAMNDCIYVYTRTYVLYIPSFCQCP